VPPGAALRYPDQVTRRVRHVQDPGPAFPGARRRDARQPRAWLLWRVEGDRAEFVTLSFWESRAAIEAFAGQDIDQAVFYPDDDQFLIERDLTVRHYEVAGTG
jgi:hypothetical protein